MTKLEDRIDMGEDPRSPVMAHGGHAGGHSGHPADTYGQYDAYNSMSYMDHTNLHLNTYAPHQIHSGSSFFLSFFLNLLVTFYVHLKAKNRQFIIYINLSSINCHI